MKPVSPVLLYSTAPEVVFAKDQPQYIPLPAVIEGPLVTTRWKLSWKERIEVFLGGSVYLQVLTYGQPLQPVKLVTDESNLHKPLLPNLPSSNLLMGINQEKNT